MVNIPINLVQVCINPSQNQVKVIFKKLFQGQKKLNLQMVVKRGECQMAPIYNGTRKKVKWRFTINQESNIKAALMLTFRENKTHQRFLAEQFIHHLR